MVDTAEHFAVKALIFITRTLQLTRTTSYYLSSIQSSSLSDLQKEVLNISLKGSSVHGEP